MSASVIYDPPEVGAECVGFAPLAKWLETHAQSLDGDRLMAAEILPRLGASGLLRVGVAAENGGCAGSVVDAIEVVADIAGCSLTAAFVFWGQRTFIEYLLHSPNRGLCDEWLPALLEGRYAGATGLSNAMKYLSNLETLQIHASELAAPGTGGPVRFTLNGNLPWVTNLRREGFLVAAAVEHSDGRAPSIFAIPSGGAGTRRSEDLDLIALRASNTAALAIEGTVVDRHYQITDNAPAFLTRVRPAFLGLQCGMSIGLARRALRAVAEVHGAARGVLAHEHAALAAGLDSTTQRLYEGIDSDELRNAPAALFELRIELADLVAEVLNLEIQASGGLGYLRGRSEVARRAREAAFIPIVTPSIIQLKSQLQFYAAAGAT